MVALVLVLKVLSIVCFSLQFLLVALIVAELVLNVVSSSSEYNNRCDLNAQASIYASRSEKGDAVADHVGTEEGGGVDHELVGMPEAIDCADNACD